MKWWSIRMEIDVCGQESSISGNRENKLHTEQENLMSFGNQSKEEEKGRKEWGFSAEICLSVDNNSGEMLNEHIVNGERWKTEGVSKKLPEVEMIHKTTGKKCSRKAGSVVPAKEECHMQSETNFELTVKKGEVTPKTGKHALDISPYKQQHFSRTHFECQHEEHCFTKNNSHNTLNSEDREFQVCGEKGDSLSGVMRGETPLGKELAAHKGSEKTKLNLQSVSNPGISESVARDANRLHRASLDKSYFIAENKILEKSNFNPNEANSTMQEVLAVSSGNISENQYAEKVSEFYPLDFEVSPVQNDPSLGTEFLGNAAELNANVALSEIISGGEFYVPLSEHGLAKKLLSHDGKVSEQKISQGKIYGLDNININGKKQSGEDKLEQADGQPCRLEIKAKKI
ncbi:PREDICTED: uncharacterized protein LOC104471653 [Pterocles gutturalis]|uniref:uncharacterized protein LOC104471653 n=1 Tax=Pterocles gutturalis TaxID=240206 RepID=UPI000528EF9C|nr:PREDICTED: uncharacterized protein LOC104471653 [Pterocles gutturalis]